MKLWIIVDPLGPFPSDCQVYRSQAAADTAVRKYAGYPSYAALNDARDYHLDLGHPGHFSDAELDALIAKHGAYDYDDLDVTLYTVEIDLHQGKRTSQES